jgi:hypothetical protein
MITRSWHKEVPNPRDHLNFAVDRANISAYFSLNE